MQKTTLMQREMRGERWERSWRVVDATGQPLGRLAVRIARILMGKDKPHYTPHVDVGDYVVVVNAAKVALTGKKLDQKSYYHYSGYPGGIRARTARRVLQEDPELPLRQAVQCMLPKTTLGRRMLKKLHVYAGAEHPHQAQGAQPLAL